MGLKKPGVIWIDWGLSTPHRRTGPSVAHGWTWPNRVAGAIELSILQRDCLNRHVATKELLVSEISAWQTKRNAKQARANRQFTNKDAGIKLHKLCPTTWLLSNTSTKHTTGCCGGVFRTE